MTLFTRIPDHVSRLLEREARRRARSVEDVALDALQRGLAFHDEPPETLPDDEATWPENPHFAEAIEALAQMDNPRS